MNLPYSIAVYKLSVFKAPPLHIRGIGSVGQMNSRLSRIRKTDECARAAAAESGFLGELYYYHTAVYTGRQSSAQGKIARARANTTTAMRQMADARVTLMPRA